jgi:hypothetical protein
MEKLSGIIKVKVDPAPEHQAIDACGVEEIKLCEIVTSGFREVGV